MHLPFSFPQDAKRRLHVRAGTVLLSGRPSIALAGARAFPMAPPNPLT